MLKKTLHFIITFLLAGVCAAQPILNFTPLTLSGPALNQPVDITGCGDGSGRLFVVEKRGTVRIILNGEVLNSFFLDIQSQVINNGERGLLGMAFHPQYPDSPYIYVNYVLTGTITNRISRFTLNPNNPNDILENSQVMLLSQTGVQTNHKAGDLAFGPDGYLYFGLGDGGGGGDPNNNGQNNEIYLAKMMRIDINSTSPPLNYSIPPDNPFVNLPGLDEIWAYGLRNPWRISFDRETGDFWIGDVGQDLWEEVDMIPAGTPGGMNFGWDCQEGNHPYEPQNCPDNTLYTWPIFEYPHTCNPCPVGRGNSLTGGFVYRGDLYPVLRGYYVCADYVSNYLWMIRQTGSDPLTFDVLVQNGSALVSALVSFGEDDNGELYACNLAGTLYAVSAKSAISIEWEDLAANRERKGNKIDWTINQTFGIDHFELQRSFRKEFEDVVPVSQIEPVENQLTYSYQDLLVQQHTLYYRVVAMLDDGTASYSSVARVIGHPESIPSLVFDHNDNMWKLHLPEGWQEGAVTLFDLQGKEVYKKPLTFDQQVDLAQPIIPGYYFVKVTGKSGNWSDKVVW